MELSKLYRLPPLAKLDKEILWSDIRMAWGKGGLVFAVRVTGKRQLLWCRESRLEESDGLQLWIDTRDTQDIHRASKFCHRFVFLPMGGQRQLPLADQLLIHRAQENARPIRPRELRVRSQCFDGGYLLEGLIPTGALTGFEPQDHPRLGFTYALYDRELGLQTFSVDSQFPYEEDPSTWATLHLVS